MKLRIKQMLRLLTRATGIELIRLTAMQRSLLRTQPDTTYRELVTDEVLTRPIGEISLAETQFLGSLVRDLAKAGPIIEVGTLFGWSTRIMAFSKSDDRDLITVDNYSWNPLGLSPKMHLRITRSVLAEAIGKFRTQQIIMDKDDFYGSYAGVSPALVFLDANHTYEATMADISWAKRISAGIICGHDYSPETCPGVVRAVDEFGGPSKRVETLWIL